MTSLTQTLTPLRQRMIDDMRMRKLSHKTQASYIRVVKRFASFLGRSPDTSSVEDLSSYQWLGPYRPTQHSSTQPCCPCRCRFAILK